jgi:hypothetical protein
MDPEFLVFMVVSDFLADLRARNETQNQNRRKPKLSKALEPV